MNTFAETELLLRTAISLSNNTVKYIANECGIKAIKVDSYLYPSRPIDRQAFSQYHFLWKEILQ